MYAEPVPRLWNQTIETHRREVRDAILDTTADIVAEQGLRAVTMSQIAQRTGIGRATLYKYFPDVEAILRAWHERHVTAHLEHLDAVRNGPGDPGAKLAAVLEAFAFIAHGMAHQSHGAQLVALLHRDDHVTQAERRLHELIRDVLAEVAETGEVRSDITADELATYCRHALNAAGELPSKAAVHRLVELTLAGLRPSEH